GRQPRMWRRIGAGPWLGRHVLLAARRDLVDVFRCEAPDLIYWTHSYLAAFAPPELLSVPSVVEFPNIERLRWRSTASVRKGPLRLAHTYEYAKADRWEPRVARQAALAVALTPEDAAVLRRDGANTVVAPNGVEARGSDISGSGSTVLAVGSWNYPPNREGL